MHCNTNTLVIIITRRCQFNCPYCAMDRTKYDMSVESLERTIDFLFTCDSDNLELQFFGGEPFLRADLIKAGINYSQNKIKTTGKQVRYLITTNGYQIDTADLDYLADYDVSFMFSLDGGPDTCRHTRNFDSTIYWQIINNIRKVRNNNFNYFINMVVPPQQVSSMCENVKYLINEGFSNFNMGYQLGVYWGPQSQKYYRDNYRKIKKYNINLNNQGADEPILASPVITVDTDKSLYVGCSAVLEKKIPFLVDLFHEGNLEQYNNIELLRRSYQQQANKIISSCSNNSTINSNLELGRQLRQDNIKKIATCKKFNYDAPRPAKNDDFIFNNVNFLQSQDVSSLMLMVTYQCQMSCTYCDIVQQELKLSLDKCRQAVDLLLSSSSNKIQLRFWGGEPLLYPELIKKTIAYAQYNNKGKQIKYMISTNGMLLEPNIGWIAKNNIELMVSLDGDIDTLRQYRRAKHNFDYSRLLKNLNLLRQKNINYFVNMVCTPENVNLLYKNYKFLKQYADRIQVCYKSGVIWRNRDILQLMSQFKKISNQQKGFMNLHNECEPVMLSDEIIVDTDGSIYYDIAVFHERVFPHLKEMLKLGDLSITKNINSLLHDKKWILRHLLQYPTKYKQTIINNNIKLGFFMREFISNHLKPWSKKTENRRLGNFIQGTIAEQANYNLGVKSYILHISNACRNNCIFCKNKKVAYSSLEYVKYRIKNNNNFAKVSIVGNEPLNHPQIIDIIKICRDCNFKNIEIMTSGFFLKDLEFLKKIMDLGVNSFSLPLYSSIEKEHDFIVGRQGDFKDLMAALDNLRKYKAKIYLHTTLLKQNIDNIKQLQIFARKITPYFCIVPVRAKMSNFAYQDLVPSYQTMINKLNTEYLVGFPLCITSKIQKKMIADASLISDSMKIYLLDQNFVKLKKCRSCPVYKKCPGTFRKYLEIYGGYTLCL